jgi:hypothetical protein
MNIHPVIAGNNRYCGPAVLSSLLKIDTGEAARRIRSKNGKRSVTGTYVWDLERVLLDEGLLLHKVFHAGPAKPTLAAWLKLSKDSRTAGRVFLISAGTHWQLVSGRRYVCGLTREIVSVRDKRVRRRSRVKAVYEVVQQ